MSFFQIQVNPQDDDLDAILSRMPPGHDLLSTIFNSPTNITLVFGPLPKTATPAVVGAIKISTVPKRH
jgi:hypothetical protein